MKNLIFAVLTLTAAVVSAASLQDIKPAAPAPKAAPTSVEWEDKNDAALTAATDEAVLAAFVADEKSATALLAQVKEAYHTDPMIACQIGAVSQWVMQPDPWYCLFWDGPHTSGRKIWVKALMARLTNAKDDYVKSFCLDQLRWCGCSCCAKCIAKFAAEEKSKAVKDFAEMVVRELER